MLKQRKAAAQRYIAQERAKLGWVPPQVQRYGSEQDGLEEQWGSNKVPHPGTRRYKTQICVHWVRRGSCTYRDKCAFAHGEAELRQHVQDEDLVQQELRRFNLGSGSGSRTEASGLAAAPGSDTASGTAVVPPPGFSSSSDATGPSTLSAEQLTELYNQMAMSDDEDGSLPEAFLCPITQASEPSETLLQ